MVFRMSSSPSDLIRASQEDPEILFSSIRAASVSECSEMCRRVTLQKPSKLKWTPLPNKIFPSGEPVYAYASVCVDANPKIYNADIWKMGRETSVVEIFLRKWCFGNSLSGFRGYFDRDPAKNTEILVSKFPFDTDERSVAGILFEKKSVIFPYVIETMKQQFGTPSDIRRTLVVDDMPVREKKLLRTLMNSFFCRDDNPSREKEVCLEICLDRLSNPKNSLISSLSENEWDQSLITRFIRISAHSEYLWNTGIRKSIIKLLSEMSDIAVYKFWDKTMKVLSLNSVLNFSRNGIFPRDHTQKTQMKWMETSCTGNVTSKDFEYPNQQNSEFGIRFER